MFSPFRYTIIYHSFVSISILTIGIFHWYTTLTHIHTYIHTYIYMPTHTVRSMSVKFIVLHCSESSCVNTQEIEAQGGLIEKLRIKSAALNETQRWLILSPHFLIVLGVFISLFLSPLLATVYLRQTNTKLIKRSNNQANQADRSLNCKITFMDSTFLYSYLNLLFYFFSLLFNDWNHSSSSHLLLIFLIIHLSIVSVEPLPAWPRRNQHCLRFELPYLLWEYILVCSSDQNRC